MSSVSNRLHKLGKNSGIIQSGYVGIYTWVTLAFNELEAIQVMPITRLKSQLSFSLIKVCIDNAQIGIYNFIISLRKLPEIFLRNGEVQKIFRKVHRHSFFEISSFNPQEAIDLYIK